MLRRSIGPILCLAGVALLLTGCGGDAAQTVSAASLSKGEFSDRAEAICSRGRLRGLRYEPSADSGQSEREALSEAIETALLPALQEVVDELYALGAPPEKEERTEKLLKALGQGVDEAEELDSPTLEDVGRLLTPAAELADKQGLEACVFS